MSASDPAQSYSPRRSVRVRFALAMGLSGVLFAVLLALWAVQAQRQQMQLAVNESVRREAEVLGQIIAMALSERQSQIQQLAAQPEVASGLMEPGALRLALERLRSAHPEFEWLAMTDAHGVITTATGTLLERQSRAGADWFVQGRRAPWIGTPHTVEALAGQLPLEEGGRPPQLIDMAVPVVDYEGRTIGVLTAMLNWRWIREMHANLVAHDPTLKHTLLLDPRGVVAIGPVALLGSKAEPVGLSDLQGGGSPSVLQWPDVGEHLTAAAPLRWSAQPGQAQWTMVLRQDPGLAFGAADRLSLRLLAAGLLGSGLFMGLSWWLAGRIVRPLRSLADTAEALREGRQAVFDVEPGRQDEMAALSRSLHDMHQELQSRMSELAAYRDHLEDKIAARTEQLEEALGKAEAANLAKGSFIANMSHEIRTPMNAIMGMTYLLQRGDLPSEQLERVRTVSQAAEHLLQIINNILDLSKIEAGMFSLQSEDFDLPALLEQVVDLVKGTAQEKHLRLVLAWRGGEAMHVHGDAMRLSQILLNLLSNAIKFTPHGEVRLLASTTAEPGDAGRAMLRVEVHDSGVGIAPEHQGKLFNAFVQADDSTTRRFGGTGLGLAITRSLLELMGGHIGVRSQIDQGSVFWFDVPLQLAAVPSVQAPTESHRMPPGPLPMSALKPGMDGLSDVEAQQLITLKYPGARVLLAEDNPVNSMLATELLGLAGLHVTHAATGAEALQHLQVQDFDLVLMDVHMPEMDGLQATRLIRQLPRGGQVPIIAMTASVLHSDQSACLDAGMDGHLGKPINTQELFQTLLRFLAHGRAGDAFAAGPAPT